MVFVRATRKPTQSLFRGRFWIFSRVSSDRRCLWAFRSNLSGDWSVRRRLAEYPYGPREGGRGTRRIAGKLLLPIHWGLFNLAFHPWREPIERLIDEADKRNLQLFLPRPGCPADVSGASLQTFWWEVQPIELQHRQHEFEPAYRSLQRYFLFETPTVKSQGNAVNGVRNVWNSEGENNRDFSD